MKRLSTLFYAFFFSALLLFFAADSILHAGTRFGLDMAREFALSHGVELLNPEIDAVHLASPRSVTWHRLRSAFRMTSHGGISTGTIFVGSADAIGAALASVALDLVEIEVTGLNIHNGLLPEARIRGSDAPRADNIRFTADYIRFSMPVSLARPIETARRALEQVRELLDGKPILWPLELRGRLLFEAGGVPTEARIVAVRSGNGSFLEMDRSDVRLISDRLGEDLTSGDVDLIARYPLKAPRLFRIADRARASAKAAHARDAGLSEDAYRHVLWSYLLTRQYGPELAETIADAHEIGSSNSEVDRLMDYNNNRVGRGYALMGMSEEEVLEKVRTDPAVIKGASLP